MTERRDRRGWVFPAVLFASIAVPLSIFAWAAWTERAHALRDAEQTAVRTVAALHEHALKVFETHELVLYEVQRQLRGRSWADIEQDRALWEYMVQVERSLDQVRVLSLADAEGRVRLSSARFPPPDLNVSDRDYFQAHREKGPRTYVSAAYQGRITGERHIALSRRLSTPDGHFNGIIHVAVPLTYLTHFWEQFTPNIAHVVPLVRADGQVIARHPSKDTPERLDLDGPFLSRALAKRQGVYTAHSRVDGVERLNAYTQIKDYPLFISFSIETGAVLKQWREGLLLEAILAAIAAGALATGATVAHRRYQAQVAAALRWERTADQLSSEMARRQAAEARLRQTQKMEAVGQLTGGIAHDFNNLLMAVLGSLELLKKRLPADDPKAAQLVNTAVQGAERGTTMIRRLLAFARKQDLNPEPVDVPALIAGISDLLQHSLGPQVEIETRSTVGLPWALVDANQLETALLNLAVNARDAMPGGGRLTISVDEEIVGPGSVLSPGRYVRVVVADNGTGMDEETLHRATDPFFTTKDTGKGTGLGLSMVHGFAVQSGGQFSLKSAPGSGTTAEMLLPVAETEPEADHAPPSFARAKAHANARLSVLVVDDDPLVLMGTVGMVEDIGHAPMAAGSAEDALAILRSGTPVDVVVTDHGMPKMTGLQLAGVIQREWRGLPVILATGYMETPDDSNIITHQLTKPFRQDQLSAALAGSTPANTQNIVPLRPRRTGSPPDD
jgi:signal transduction histidine kinase/ActR/RegA family two-component response regulator